MVPVREKDVHPTYCSDTSKGIKMLTPDSSNSGRRD